jgi:hypothetical protein
MKVFLGALLVGWISEIRKMKKKFILNTLKNLSYTLKRLLYNKKMGINAISINKVCVELNSSLNGVNIILIFVLIY